MGIYSGTVIVNVSDWRNGCVCVFSVHYDGQFVTSFGNGHITDPYGVAVDSDGFVYVCSKESVVIF